MGGKFSTIRFWFAVIIIVISTLKMIFYLSLDFHTEHLFWVIFFFLSSLPPHSTLVKKSSLVRMWKREVMPFIICYFS